MMDFRLDRLATVHLAGPVSRIWPRRAKTRIPILMYHAVREEVSGFRPYYETNVSPPVFARQIRQLRSDGYRSVNLDEAVHILQNGGSSEKCVVITFDDGYRDFYDTAFPILSECNFSATVFLMAGFSSDQHRYFKGKECLTWGEVRELQRHGITFGSHTLTHPQLKFLELDQVDLELGTSKEIIEDHIGVAVNSFSYPYAFPEADVGFVRNLKETLIARGYENGVTTIIGTANPSCDRLFMPRLPVNQWDDISFFKAKLDGAYDWLHRAQYLSKLLGRLRPGQADEQRVPVAGS
jgi:peptidoglycan/xylan/chitin deacetylase (PgdA/CDA1 family)